MKDHTNNAEERNEFILKYKVKDNKIFVYYANKDVVSYEYSKEKEEIIKNAMYKQVDGLKENHDHSKLKLAAVLLFFALFAYGSTHSLTFPLILFSGSVISAGDNFYRRYLNKDIQKHVLFKENKEVINDNLQKESVLNGVSKKTVKTIESNSNTLDINNLDLISLKSLKRILLNIKRNSLFEENKPKELVKRQTT